MCIFTLASAPANGFTQDDGKTEDNMKSYQKGLAGGETFTMVRRRQGMSRRGEARTVSLHRADCFIRRSWRGAKTFQGDTFGFRTSLILFFSFSSHFHPPYSVLAKEKVHNVIFHTTLHSFFNRDLLKNAISYMHVHVRAHTHTHTYSPFS